MTNMFKVIIYKTRNEPIRIYFYVKKGKWDAQVHRKQRECSQIAITSLY